MTSITAVTPWLNHMELAPDYWQALRHADCEVLVIDNGSYPPLPNGLRLDYNSGFAHASNLGLAMARTDAVLFLNSDIAATAAGWLEPLRDALEPGVLVGAELRYDWHGSVDGYTLPYLDGWCLAGMRADLLDLGGFDADYAEPAYYSDNDLCLRARAAGMVLREAKVSLVHKLNVTAGRGADVRTVTGLNYERFAARARDLMEVAA